MYQYNYGYQYPYYGAQPPVADTLAQLRLNNSGHVQTAITGHPTAQQAQPSNSLVWVQGEAGAKSYLVAPNTTVMLMDSEGERFYLKSSDASGVPMPLRVFDYKERTTMPSNAVKRSTIDDNASVEEFITRKEFDEFRALIASQGIMQKTDEVSANG